jgi:beta-phosphoglucomutase-like phosphatase (HAD superfamily)
MTKKRTHLLLEPEQHRALRQMAQREGRSVSDLTREIVQEGIEQRQEMYTQEKKRRLQALERARQVRQAILDERKGTPLSVDVPRLIEELREDRDDQILSRGH